MFLPYMAWRPSWSCDLHHLCKFLFPLSKEAPHLVTPGRMFGQWSGVLFFPGKYIYRRDVARHNGLLPARLLVLITLPVYLHSSIRTPSHDALYVGNRAAPSSVDGLFDFMLSVDAGRHRPLHVGDSVVPLLAGPRDGRGWTLITLPLMRQLSLIGASSVRTGVLS